MQGIYIHIPFCAQACHYCDFHFSTSQQFRSQMIEMICKEIELRKEYLTSKHIDTIYFGGGTPSILEKNELERILNTISRIFLIDPNCEISLEANPDDLDSKKIDTLRTSGVNRLSIGIQSFNDGHLKFLNRIHNSKDAVSCIERCQKAGFENLTIDLIYGIESPNHEIWESDLDFAFSLNIPHLSAYCLTIEPATVFGNWVKKKKIKEVDEEFSAQQFEILTYKTEKVGMEQYEISNFSIPGMYSRHNSNYWLGGKYLGVGPSAHSYNGEFRQFNVSNNPAYIKALKEEILPSEKDELTDKDRFNEGLMTGLRTKWGFDIGKFEKSGKIPESFPDSKLVEFENSGLIIRREGFLTLSKAGKLLADRITLELFA